MAEVKQVEGGTLFAGEGNTWQEAARDVVDAITKEAGFEVPAEIQLVLDIALAPDDDLKQILADNAVEVRKILAKYADEAYVAQDDSAFMENALTAVLWSQPGHVIDLGDTLTDNVAKKIAQGVIVPQFKGTKLRAVDTTPAPTSVN